MSESGDGEHAIEATIADLYRGPLGDFVSRRDLLAKELRSSGELDSAAAVKALKKPSRTAWALNLAVIESPNAMDALVAAIGEAQSSGADVRASIASMRTAVRELATEAARLAGSVGEDVEKGLLVAALSAVVGTSESFDQLRRGRLTDIPEAGGLDLLGSLPTLPTEDAAPRPAKPPRVLMPGSAAARSQQKDTRAAGREAAEKAASELASALERAGEAKEALRKAEARATAAGARAREAEEDAREARSRRDQAQQDAAEAAAAVEAAQAAAEDAKRRLKP
jgi:hypothetical protein